MEELRNLEDASGVPIIFLLNKQDLPDALDPELLKKMLEIEDELVFRASAIDETGVFDGLKAAAKIGLEKLTR